MIKRAFELNVIEKVVRNGPGPFRITKLADTEDLRGVGHEMAKIVVMPGCGSGYHTHDNNCEIYYVLEGEGEYNDNGTMTTVSQGDVMVTKDGNGHCIVNKSEQPLVILSAII